MRETGAVQQLVRARFKGYAGCRNLAAAPFVSKMLLRTCVWLLFAIGPVVYKPVDGQYISSPCPDIFSYRMDPATDTPFGYIELQNLRIGQLVKLNVDLSIAVAVPKDNVGSITLVKSRSQTFLDILNKRPAQYRVNFPFTNIYPHVLAISVNGQAICTGQKVKGPIVTTINLEHTLYTQVQQLSNGNSNGNPPNQYRPEQQPIVNQERIQLPDQQYNTPAPAIIYQQQQFTTQRPSFVYQPQQQQPSLYRPQHTSGESLESVCGSVGPLASRLSINGIRSSKGQFPWAAPIFNTAEQPKPQYICGSSIITSQHVVTAAHCMHYPDGTKRRNSQLSVIPGMYNIDSFFDSANQDRGVVQIVVHSDYFFEDTEATDSDIAVLKLDAPVTFNDLVRPICIWSWSDNLEQIVGENGFVSGWGITESGNSKFPSFVTATVVDKRDCSRQLGRFVPPKARTFCADGHGAVPCNGDSGSGLAFKRGTRYYLRGIVSTGQRDMITLLCDTKKYVVYTDVAPFRYWLSRVVKG
ncbi:serine protease gd-like [Anopheles albimanus]|uniref:serine protease gd-like n=1 Tax=Anopheles albimanus TaxID=7167 RepID=UPI00163EBD28|nr:serine protease gd-like [Anopheles albimanus]